MAHVVISLQGPKPVAVLALKSGDAALYLEPRWTG